MQNDGFCRKEAGHYPCVGQKNTHVWSNRPFSPLLGTKQKDFDAHRAKCSAKGRTRLSHCGPWPGQVLCQNAPNLDKSPLNCLGTSCNKGVPPSSQRTLLLFTPHVLCTPPQTYGLGPTRVAPPGFGSRSFRVPRSGFQVPA